MAHRDRQLLQQFLSSGSSDDFAPIVDQYLNLVYSTARKMSSSGGGQLEDICQTVFADLARKAQQIPEQTPLSGWLYRHTCFVASNLNRSERRRRERERQALEMSESQTSPDVPNEELHLAMTELPDADRNALVLRFMDEWDLRRVGERLGISEDAAQKRVSRALDKLRTILGRKGVTASAATLAVCLGQQVVAAPLAAQSVAVAAVGASASAGIIPAILELMKAPLAKVAAIVVIGAGVAASMQHQNTQITELRKRNHDLAAKVSRLADLEAENQQLRKLRLDPDEAANLRKKAAEVHQLRAEIGRIRQQMREQKTVDVSGTPSPQEVEHTEESETTPSEPQFMFSTKIIGRSEDSPEAELPGFLANHALGSSAVFVTPQVESMMRHFAETPGFDILTAPRLFAQSGHAAQAQVVESTTIVSGFHTRADGAKFDLVKTNIMTGITMDITGTEQANGTHLQIRLNVTTFEGYLDDGAGISKTAVSEGVWYHETAPIVDIAQAQTSALLAEEQTIMMHVTSKPAGKEYWLFFTPSLVDLNTLKRIDLQEAKARYSSRIASGVETKLRTKPTPLAR